MEANVMDDREFLLSAGLSPESPAANPVNPKTLDVKDIKFTEDMMDGIDPRENRNAAVTALWNKFRSDGSDRNKAIWAAAQAWVNSYIDTTRSGGQIKEAVKATAEERALAKLIASHGITVEDLSALLAKHKEN